MGIMNKIKGNKDQPPRLAFVVTEILELGRTERSLMGGEKSVHPCTVRSNATHDEGPEPNTSQDREEITDIHRHDRQHPRANVNLKSEKVYQDQTYRR